jgi:hypothetical protein
MKERVFLALAGLAVCVVSVLLIGRVLPMIASEMDKVVLFSHVRILGTQDYWIVMYFFLLHILCAALLLGVTFITKGAARKEDELGVISGITTSFIVGIPLVLICLLFGPLFVMEAITLSEYIKWGILAVYVTYPIVGGIILALSVIAEYTTAFQKIKNASV